MFIICLIEKYIFSILTLGGIWLKKTIWSNTVLSAKLLPEFVSDYRLGKIKYIDILTKKNLL
jgi:hypothetical protein